MKITTKAESFLVVMTVLWGLTFPLLHYAVQFISPEIIVFARFLLATVFIFPFIGKAHKQTTRFLLFGGFVLGLLNCGVYVCQTIGLQTVDGTRAAFITGFNVLLVPFMAPLFKLGKPRAIDYISAFLCVIGLYIITGANLLAVQRGDLWILACAISVALSILVIQWLTKRTQDYLLLTFYQMLFTAILSLFLLLDGQLYWHYNVIAFGMILFCALFATVLTLLIQIRFQHYTTVVKAAIIFTLEPVFATLFDWLMNRHSIGMSTVMGGSVIVISMLLPEIIGIIRIKIN